MLKFKKIIGLVLIATMIINLSVVGFAKEDNKSITTSNTSLGLEAISDIPVYITYIESGDEKEINKIKENSNNLISNGKVSSTVEKDINTKVYEEIGSYEIVKVSSSEKNALSTNPFLVDNFKSVEELITDGVEVNYINVFMPSESKINNYYDGTKSSYTNDPFYWESNLTQLGTYNGYNFLYSEISVSAESEFKDAGNLSGGMNWSHIIAMTAKTVADRLVNNVYYNTGSLCYTLVSNFIDSYNPPIRITFEPSHEYLRLKVRGDLYIRTVYIRDLDHRINDYAYYKWGTSSRYASVTDWEIKYAESQNQSGTYEYNEDSGSYDNYDILTPGYYGGPTFLSTLYNLYKNPIGYFTHNETIDVRSAIINLLN